MTKKNLDTPVSGESKEAEPTIKIEFYFGVHADDGTYVQDFTERCKSADVVVLEGAGWNVEDVKFMQRYMDGKVPQDAMDEVYGNKFILGVLENLYSSNKVFMNVDVSDGPFASKLHNLMSAFNTNFAKGGYSFIHGKFEEALQCSRIAADIMYVANVEREKAIVHNIHNRISKAGKLVKDYPRLKEKTEIKVLIFFGFAHSTVYHDYRRKYHDVPAANLSFLGSNIASAPMDEFCKRKRRGLSASDELLAQAVFEPLINRVMNEYIRGDWNKIEEAAFVLARRFNLDEIKEIAENFVKNPYSHSFARSVLEAAFHQKGMSFPTTEADLNRLLHKWKLP